MIQEIQNNEEIEIQGDGHCIESKSYQSIERVVGKAGGNNWGYANEEWRK